MHLFDVLRSKSGADEKATVEAAGYPGMLPCIKSRGCYKYKMLRIGWLENPDNIVYADLNEFADNFGNEVGISNLKQEILNFRQNPTAEGIVLKGKKRSALKLFVPDMLFDKHIEMGENVWVFIGETYPAYCIY